MKQERSDDPSRRFTATSPSRTTRFESHIKLFIDSDVLISAASGKSPMREKCLALCADPRHTFVYSPFLKLEVLLLPTFYRRDLEREFHEAYFKTATCFGDLNRIFEIGQKEACRHGIAVLDAMHIAAAHLMHCDGLVTLEKTTKPMFRTTLVNIISPR